MYRSLSWFAFFGLFPLSGGAADIYAHFPDSIHANERYVIYSHGLMGVKPLKAWVEKTNR
jgi:hypothetical protein